MVAGGKHGLGAVRMMAATIICGVGLALATLAALAVNVPAAQALPPGEWSIAFDDEFNSVGLNTAIWTPGWQHGGISGPMSGSCLDSNLAQQTGNGYLWLEIHHETSKCSGTEVQNTGSLVESNPGDGVPGHVGYKYTYGYVEWRVYIPGVGAAGCPKKGCLPDWPAVWSLPENHRVEIDTMEGLGSLGQACFHLPPPFGKEAPGSCVTGSYATEWHTFAADWEPGVVTYYYDGTKVGQITSSEINEPQYLVMDDVLPTDGQPLVVPNTMSIDYVKVWQHPAPSATTAAPTNVQQRQATFHGSVNPHGLPTTYYFQYGYTSSYGAQTSEISAGSGSSTIGVQTVGTGLSTGRTVHYRLVARNATGVTYGADRMFSTPGGWALTFGGTNTNPQKDVYYRSASGQIAYWYWNGSKWLSGALPSGEAAAAGTTPTAYSIGGTIAEPKEAVFYVGASGQICYWYFNGGTWENVILHGEAAAANSSPTVIPFGGTSEESNVDVFYVGANGRTWYWYSNRIKWANAQVKAEGEEAVAANTSPIAVMFGGTNEEPNDFVFYTGADGNIWYWYWNRTKWIPVSLTSTEPVASHTSPTVLLTGESSEEPNVYLYYTGAGRGVWQWRWNAGTWIHERVPGGELAATNASPDVVAFGGTGEGPNQDVYHVGQDNHVWYRYYNRTQWASEKLSAAGEGVPAATLTPMVVTYGESSESPNEDAYYEGTNGQIWSWSWNGATWKNEML